MDKQKKTLLIDFDDVIVDSGMLAMVNQFLGTNYKIEDFSDYIIDDIIPKEKREEFYNFFSNNNMYDDIKLFDGAKEILKKLTKKYDVYICSSCLVYNSYKNSGNLFKHKFEFLIKELPFLDPFKFIFTSSKHVVCGDIIIDDNIKNLNGNIKTKLLFTSYHNKNYTKQQLDNLNIIRVDSWRDIEKVLM